jgi:hypothetical protein
MVEKEGESNVDVDECLEEDCESEKRDYYTDEDKQDAPNLQDDKQVVESAVAAVDYRNIDEVEPGSKVSPHHKTKSM